MRERVLHRGYPLINVNKTTAFGEEKKGSSGFPPPPLSRSTNQTMFRVDRAHGPRTGKRDGWLTWRATWVWESG